ncbi:aminodeoxychorismate synthase component I [Paenibacillus sp. Z3-2]
MNQPDANPYILFDFVGEDRCKQRKIFRNPVEVIKATSIEEVKPALRQIQDAVDQGYYAVGYVSYEAAPAFDPAFRVHSDVVLPLIWFGIFGGYDTGYASSSDEYRISEWEPTVTEKTYHQNIHKIHEAIARGDTYQVNYTMRLRSEYEGDPYAFYTKLCDAQQADYSAMLQLGDISILSASPELFFKKNGNQLETRPMKGTVKRGFYQEQDDELADWLYQSPKNRAENVMITDLLRNDLSVIAETGSVHVPRLFDIEKYYTLFQMTSTVTANTRSHIQLEDMFSALFPCGSITGAPKISTMDLIYELEDTPREIYCGSIGMLSPDGSSVFNVAIRTVWIDHQRNQAEYGVGGGITWDSTASDEYAEAKTKALMLTEQKPYFELLESLRLENGHYSLLERHLDRMMESASYFNFEAIREDIHNQLTAYANEHSTGLHKVRVLLSPVGQISVESTPLIETKETQTVALAKSSILSSQRFLYHKTTYRDMYDVHRMACGDGYDVLLWNEHRELTEFTTGNVVIEQQGKKYTPPRDSGLLAGTLRNQLLYDGVLEEKVLTYRDITEATNIWLINSVRGWIPVEVSQESLEHSLHELTITSGQ